MTNKLMCAWRAVCRALVPSNKKDNEREHLCRRPLDKCHSCQPHSSMTGSLTGMPEMQRKKKGHKRPKPPKQPEY